MSQPLCYRCEGTGMLGPGQPWQRTCPVCEGSGWAARPYDAFKPGDRVIGVAPGGWAGERGTVREAAQWDKNIGRWQMRVQPDHQTAEDHATMRTTWDPAFTQLVDAPTVDDLSKALRAHPKLLFALIQDFRDTLPPVLGPWTRDGDSENEGRHDIFNNQAAYVKGIITGWAALVLQDKHPFRGTFKSAEEARIAIDSYLQLQGWTLL